MYWAEHFAASNDLDGKSNLASLIARYATDAILPQVNEELDKNVGKCACAIQSPLLAYFLRVNPVSARTFIEKAIAARGEGFTACNHELFQLVSEIHYDPLLEEVAIKSLDDPDPEVAATAATMLGKFGSPAAKSGLLERYASWAEQWTGREQELDRNFADLNPNIYQLGLGQNLVQALATGRFWLSDKDALQRLAQQTKVRQVRQQLENYLKLWNGESISVFIDPPSFGFHARVVQYEFQSLDALKEKLVQFPFGTTFALNISTNESSASQTTAELRNFLTSHGMSVVPERR